MPLTTTQTEQNRKIVIDLLNTIAKLAEFYEDSETGSKLRAIEDQVVDFSKRRNIVLDTKDQPTIDYLDQLIWISINATALIQSFELESWLRFYERSKVAEV